MEGVGTTNLRTARAAERHRGHTATRPHGNAGHVATGMDDLRTYPIANWKSVANRRGCCFESRRQQLDMIAGGREQSRNNWASMAVRGRMGGEDDDDDDDDDDDAVRQLLRRASEIFIVGRVGWMPLSGRLTAFDDTM
ncbi:MAG: hypothetical protein M1815_003058 [Lichina confinis]|nr:MAG: hypothetical protein M1815_003058 [Lichina confinis]